MPHDAEEFARIIARNFPEQPMFKPEMYELTGEEETYTVFYAPGIGRIDITFTPDF